jgi:5-methylcytosine-specific restriction endonuclease McrA
MANSKSMSFRYGRHWSRTRRAIRRRDQGRCVRCGAKDALTVHHLDGNTRNNANDNLVTLCIGCHNEVQGEPGPGATESETPHE